MRPAHTPFIFCTNIHTPHPHPVAPSPPLPLLYPSHTYNLTPCILTPDSSTRLLESVWAKKTGREGKGGTVSLAQRFFCVVRLSKGRMRLFVFILFVNRCSSFSVCFFPLARFPITPSWPSPPAVDDWLSSFNLSCPLKKISVAHHFLHSTQPHSNTPPPVWSSPTLPFPSPPPQSHAATDVGKKRVLFKAGKSHISPQAHNHSHNKKKQTPTSPPPRFLPSPPPHPVPPIPRSPLLDFSFLTLTQSTRRQ